MADDYTIRPASGGSQPVRPEQINAAAGTGIVGKAADGRVINTPAPVKMEANPLGFLFEIGKGLLEPIIKKEEQKKYLEGMARTVAGETAADIDHERPAWARAFGDSQAVAGARAYEGATDASRLESALYTAMPELIKRDGNEVAGEASNIIGKMVTGDPVRDQSLAAMLPQILPNILRMHATGRAKWLQDEAIRMDTESKVGAIKAFYSAEEALKTTPALDSTDAQVLSRNNKNLADALMTPAPGQDVGQFMSRSVGVLMADVSGGNFAAAYTAIDHGLLDKLETSNPGMGPRLMDHIRKEEGQKLKQTAFVTTPDLVVVMSRLRAGTAGTPEEVQNIVKGINAKTAQAAGVRYGKLIDGDQESQFIGDAVREENRDAKEAAREEKAHKAELAREHRADVRLALAEKKIADKEAKRQAKEDFEDGVREGYRNKLITGSQDQPGVDQSNNRVVAQAARDFLKNSKIKEHDTDKVEYEAFATAIQQGAGPATRVLGMLPGGQVPRRFRDIVASGQASGAADPLVALATYDRIKDNPDLIARVWDKAEDAKAIRESYTRLEQSGKLAVLQPLPPGSPPEVEQQYIKARESAGKDLSLLAQERKARDTLGDLSKTFNHATVNVNKAKAAVRNLTEDTYGTALTSITRGKIEQAVAWQVGHLMGHEGVSPDALVKQSWAAVQDSMLPMGTKNVALPLPGTPGMATLGLSAPKLRTTAGWDSALLAALSDKGGGAAYKLEDVKEIYYGKGERGAQLYIHLLINGRLQTVSMPEFDVRKHIKE